MPEGLKESWSEPGLLCGEQASIAVILKLPSESKSSGDTEMKFLVLLMLKILHP